MALMIAALASTPAARADPDPAVRWREVWSGADASSDVWLVYSGVTVAPWSQIHGEGVRLRVVSGYGQYTFEDHLRRPAGDKDNPISEFHAKTAFADALVGYLWRFDPLTAKVFVGISAITHVVAPAGAETDRQGLEVGPKGAVELWLNMGPNAWGSFDLNWTTAHDTGAARLRTAYRVMPKLSAGVESGVNSTGEFQDLRGGAFVRYDWDGGEISASGGLAGNFSGLRSGDTDPYMTVNWITQF
jgi:hypothetical protein